MDLKSFLPGKDGALGELYWSLVIEPEWVQAGVWYIGKAKAEVISIGPATAWMTDEELVDSADAALSAAIQKLPEDLGEPSKAVFGVSNHWVSEGVIKPEYLDKIKIICQKLSLEPVGFVVLSEALSHFIKSEEGSPLNGITVEVGKENMEISLFRLGNQAGTTLVARSVNPADDIAEGLARFASEEAFPSRLIVYDGKEGELDDVRQNILSASWENYEKVKFLHTPKVEVFSPDKKVTAVALAGASEIAKVVKISSPKEDEPEETQPPITAPREELENVKEVKADDLGFVFDKDIAAVDSPPENRVPEAPPPSVLQKPTTPVFGEPKTSGGESKLKKFGENFLAFPKTFFGKLSRVLQPEPSVSQKNKEGKNPFILGAIVFAAILIFGFVFWWYYPKAEIVIYVSPQNLEESIELSVVPDADEVDLENKILPGEVVAEKETGEKTKSTTGTKTVGERAKGEVKLYRSGSELQLEAGTELVSSGNLKFTLNDDVSVASGSASSPGVSTVSVTASEIGSEYNLGSGSSFEVGNYPTSDIEAKNESDFSGGSSREINAVSESDQEELEVELTKELADKALDSIESGLAEDQYLIRESLLTSVSEREFSDKVGDEASNLKLSLSVETKAVIIKKEQLINLAKEILKGEVASGYVLREDQINASFELEGEEEGEYKLKVYLKANLLPELKLDEIVTKIAGKYPTLAREYLSSIEGFSRAEVTLKPHFPGKLGIIPRVQKNITIEIAAEQ